MILKLLKWLLGFEVDFESTPNDEYKGDDLDRPLFYFNDEDEFTIRNSFESIVVTGSVGSGKSSGSGATIARSFLKSGYGGLVLCVKADEADTWKKYARETGRENDIILFNPSNPYRFNFLEYETLNSSSEVGLTSNLAQLFQTISETSRRNEGASNQSFWEKTLNELIKNVIALINLSGNLLSVESMLEIITSAPQSIEHLNQDYFQRTSFCFKCIEMMMRNENEKGNKEVALTLGYWTNRYPSLAEKTRSIIDVSFTAIADIFLRGSFADLFASNESNISPDIIFNEGKIIVVDLPIHQFREAGQMAQILWKYCVQRAAERRTITTVAKPVFIYGDEYQYLYSSKDSLFMTTNRSLRVSVVALTQNLSNFYSILGGENKRSEVDAFLGKF